MTREVGVTDASTSHLPQVDALVAAAGLPVEGLTDQFPGSYILVQRAGRVVACAGLEVYGQSGLLRSVAVVSELRGEGLGKVLVGNLLERAHELRLDVVYLLTTTAADYFRRLGFRPVERGDLPEAFAHSPEFARICPASATTLFLRL